MIAEMAEEDEDNLRGPSLTEDHDPEEEIQDFRFLLAQSQKLPSRGVKDFEPHGTNLQQSTLEASREAMHIALSHKRFHGPDKSRAVYDPDGNGAWVFNPMGVWTKSVGRMIPVPGRVTNLPPDAEGKIREQKLMRMWLLPEEALWLVERGSLDMRYPAEAGQEEDEGLPMSLQGAYAAFIGKESEGGLTLEQFIVYQYLKRCGYNVYRARYNLHNIPRPASSAMTAQGMTPSNSTTCGFWQWLTGTSTSSGNNGAKLGPLVKPGLYRSYNDIFQQLSLIPFHDPKLQAAAQPPDTERSDLAITWHVYKTDPKFKKSAPGPPDFYIIVLPARDTFVPTDAELDALLLQSPYHPPQPQDGLNMKLKRGYRNVIIAIVDSGVLSFIDVSDAGFGCEKLWDREPTKGGKSGGSGKRGRGRHRGAKT
ncbi:uncharacterized protein PV09_02322 [Verruconis gallopava]|uniref:tRNA-splicing endonuclease subunit Sen54 N-terminal domain-containing protein n=1 Tax=Verruconis gallopava TaxID=253628 RepID=A0A0D1Z0W3_9PEZI|nr:uncharacterized protein PV09_02322 [Verruconis gallopava]KIW06607.1 hypothetical protein PV09_02322 [Verruconis gallopava]